MSFVVGIAMVRDEADIIGPVVAHMLEQVDHVIVADNGSTDGTRNILQSFDVEIVDDPERGYFQSRKMTALAQLAAEACADWVVPFDADEWWYSPFGRIGDVLTELAPQWLVASAALYDHRATGADPDDDNPISRMGWRTKEPAPLPKVACRTRDDLVIEQGNHGASYTGGATAFPGLLVVRHFAYRSAAQFIRKARNGAAAYAATDLPVEVGAHWRGYGAIADAYGEDALGDVFREWFWTRFPQLDDRLMFDPAP